MNIDTRPPAPAPFEGIDLPSFTLTSSTLTDRRRPPRAEAHSPPTWRGRGSRRARQASC